MPNWDTEAKRLLKAELVRQGIGYKVLVAKLADIGVMDTESAIANKISRGKFSMAFFMQCMNAIGVANVSVAVQGLEKTNTASK